MPAVARDRKPEKHNRNGSVAKADELPHNLQVERALLGAILLMTGAENGGLERITDILLDIGGEHVANARERLDNWDLDVEPLFFSRANELVFGAMASLVEAERPFDLTVLCSELLAHGALESVGGAPYIAGLEDDVISLGQVPTYVAIVRDHWSRRYLYRKAREIALGAMEGSVSGALDRLETELIAPLNRSSDQIQWWALDDLMEAEDGVSLVGEAVIEQSEPCVIVGPPGVGKSRLIAQLALDIAMGVEHWLGVFPIRRHGLKIAMLQTENSKARMKREMKAALRGCDREQRQRVNDLIRWQALNTVDDMVPTLSDPAVVSRLAQGVSRLNPDLVIVDPLNAFFVGDNENDAMQMRQTIRLLQRIVTTGRPDRTLIILHHSRSGKAAAAGSDGWDAGSYGRGSKALTGWCRSQINVAPGAGGDNDTLVISCGKCSNGPRWATFAVNLDVEHMLYRVDPEFDLEAWREEVGGKGQRNKGEGRAVQADVIRMIMQDAGAVRDNQGWLKRSDLCTRISDATGVHRSTAWRAVQWAEKHGVLLESAGAYQLKAAKQ